MILLFPSADRCKTSVTLSRRYIFLSPRDTSHYRDNMLMFSLGGYPLNHFKYVMRVELNLLRLK